MKGLFILILSIGILPIYSCLNNKKVIENTAIAQTTITNYALIDTYFLQDNNTCIDNYNYYDLYQIVHIITKAKKRYKDSLEIDVLYSYYPIYENFPKSFKNKYILKFNQVIKDSLPNDSIVMKRTFIPRNDFFIMRGTFHDISNSLDKYKIEIHDNLHYWRKDSAYAYSFNRRYLSAEEASQSSDTLYFSTLSSLKEYYENIGVYLIYKWKIPPHFKLIKK